MADRIDGDRAPHGSADAPMHMAIMHMAMKARSRYAGLRSGGSTSLPPSPSPTAPLLLVEHLSVERGGRIVLRDLGFALGAGETMLVAGRNGAGKSTLLRTLAGLLPPSAGTIRYGLADDDTRGVETIHYLGYEDALKPTLTVEENLAFWAAMLRGPSAALRRQDIPVADALDAFGIARLANLPSAYLSAGQKRRVALARLLLGWRPVWLLDEPLIALDSAAQAGLTDLMARHTQAGGAILVASHQPLALPHRRLDLAARIGHADLLAGDGA